ncbi:MAG: hypothetical protein DMG61_19355, partial [Acidobacteria bacterium]
MLRNMHCSRSLSRSTSGSRSNIPDPEAQIKTSCGRCRNICPALHYATIVCLRFTTSLREVIRVPGLRRPLVLFLLVLVGLPITFAVEAPKLVQQDGRWALLVEGHPYLILGGQVHNSSAWPSELPQVWKSLEALHANTIEAPVYWEQIESRPSQFDWTNVDQLVRGAREHNLHVVLLWFGTWKNGNMHYVPEWVKTDTKRFPRVIRADGEPTDVLSANSRANLEADKAAFVAL